MIWGVAKKFEVIGLYNKIFDCIKLQIYIYIFEIVNCLLHYIYIGIGYYFMNFIAIDCKKLTKISQIKLLQ